MEFPLILHIGKVAIPFHAVAELLSFYFGFKYFQYCKKKRGDILSDENRWWIIFGAAIGALVGSRLLAALENNPTLFFNPPTILYYYLGGKTIVGGLIGGILGVEIIKKIIGEKKKSGDLFVFPLIVAIITGRIGCLLTGVSDGTVGNPSDVIWAFDQGDGIARHPTSLYEILFLIVAWFVLSKASKKAFLQEGNLFKVFMASYLLFRFMIEFIKPNTALIFGLSAIQVVSLVTALIYLYYIWKTQTHKTQTIQ